MTKTPHRGDKNDCGRNGSHWVVQESSEDLSQNGSEYAVDRRSTKDSAKRSPTVGFSEEDARRLHHPHDNAMVVSIRIEDYNMHKVLIDNRSSADILYYPALQQMGISRERLVPTNAPLVGFGGTRVLPLGVVTLSVMVGDYPQQITKNVTFLVVDCSSAYNAILGRLALNS